MKEVIYISLRLNSKGVYFDENIKFLIKRIPAYDRKTVIEAANEADSTQN